MVLIFTHKDPDDDAFSSVFFVEHIIKNGLGKDCRKVIDYYPDRLEWLADVSERKDIIKDYKGFNIEWAIIVDCYKPTNLTIEHRRLLKRAKKVTVFDHHSDQFKEKWRKLNKNTEFFINPLANSTGEVLLSHFEHLHKNNPEYFRGTGIINALLSGLYNDTTGFRVCPNLNSDYLCSLLKLGGDLGFVIRNQYCGPSTLRKICYVGEIIKRGKYNPKAKCLILETDDEELQARYNPHYKYDTNLKPPQWILSFLRFNNSRYSKEDKAIILIFKRKTKEITIIIDLYNDDKKIIEGLVSIGMKNVRLGQKRFFYTVDETKKNLNSILSQILKAFIN